MTLILGIDPGTEESAYVTFDGTQVWDHGILPNEDMMKIIDQSNAYMPLAIEMVACYGMAVGKEVFETVYWIGRFVERRGAEWCHRLYRKDIKLHLCGSVRAKDQNVRQALIDRFGPGKAKAMGVKKAQGPLYGIKSHEWAALATAVTYVDSIQEIA